MTHPPRSRVNTCAHVCTYLIHALSRKVLILTKPKGKIYKTKSLRNYITHRQLLKLWKGLVLDNPHISDEEITEKMVTNMLLISVRLKDLNWKFV